MKNSLTSLLVACLLIFTSCQNSNETKVAFTSKNLTYAKGFTVQRSGDYKKITIQNPYKNASKKYTYLLVPKHLEIPKHDPETQIIRTPVERMVVTSTSHIPLLELLNVEKTLVGFPNTDFISSKRTRKLIKDKTLIDLGKSESINTEILLDLAPELVMSFAVDKPNKTFTNIKKMGIPIVLNGDWLEETPLGRAEWIQLFGAIYEKEKEADSIFKKIETDYNKAKATATSANTRPTIVSGSIFQDVWYLPAGESFIATYFKDAKTDYLWKDSKGTGSLSLSFETVLEKGQHANFWIGCSLYETKQALAAGSIHYKKFDAFAQNTYTFANRKGETGGLVYFELGPIRPDLILKDIIKITHPELLPEHKLFFFEKLK